MQLQNKTAVILGVADETSISWAIARRLMEHGAKIHIGYQQKFFSRVRLLMQKYPQVSGARCDITKPEELTAFFAQFAQTPIDILIHGIAYGPPDVFTNPPSQIAAESFATTMEISAHSLLKVSGFAKPYLSEWGSIMTLTYQASEHASPFYGMMGVAKAALESAVRYLAIEMGELRVRVNAISPGPIETPAALGEMLAFLRNPEALATPAGAVLRSAVAEIQTDPVLSAEDDQAKAKRLWNVVQTRVAGECAIREFVNQDDVGDCALFLASDLSRKITGQVLRIDCGMSTSRIMPAVDSIATLRGQDHVAAAPTQAAAAAPAPPPPPAPRIDDNSKAVLDYLDAAFPGYAVSELGGGPGAAHWYAIDGEDFLGSLIASPEFVQLPADEINSRLSQWSTAELLRQANRSPLVATLDNLVFAIPDLGQTVAEWSPEALVSPDFDPLRPLEFEFPDAGQRKAFAQRLDAMDCDGVECHAADDDARLSVRSPRRHLLAIVQEAERGFSGRVPAPQVARLVWD